MICCCFQFLIDSTLKAESEVCEQKAVNENLSKQLERLDSLVEVRRSTVLTAKQAALAAAANLCMHPPPQSG